MMSGIVPAAAPAPAAEVPVSAATHAPAGKHKASTFDATLDAATGKDDTALRKRAAAKSDADDGDVAVKGRPRPRAAHEKNAKAAEKPSRRHADPITLAEWMLTGTQQPADALSQPLDGMGGSQTKDADQPTAEKGDAWWDIPVDALVVPAVPVPDLPLREVVPASAEKGGITVAVTPVLQDLELNSTVAAKTNVAAAVKVADDPGTPAGSAAQEVETAPLDTLIPAPTEHLAAEPQIAAANGTAQPRVSPQPNGRAKAAPLEAKHAKPAPPEAQTDATADALRAIAQQQPQSTNESEPQPARTESRQANTVRPVRTAPAATTQTNPMTAQSSTPAIAASETPAVDGAVVDVQPAAATQAVRDLPFAAARMTAAAGQTPQFDASAGGNSQSFGDGDARRSPAAARLAAALSSAAPVETASSAPQVFNVPVTMPATPAATTTPAAPVENATPAAATMIPDADNVQRLVQTMRVAARSGGWEATVHLKPEHLGEVSISLRVDGNNVSAMVNAEASGVREWLRAQEGSVRSGLAEQGLNLDRFVVDRDGRQQQSQQQDQDQPQRRQQPRRQAAQDPERFEIVV